MRIHIVDPSAYTPPYDDALCRALGRAGAEVELYTTRYTYEPLGAADGYLRREHFYRVAHGRATAAEQPAAAAGLPRRSRSLGLRALKLAEHVPDMLRYRRLAGRADVVHFQWLPVQPLDVHLLPRRGSAGNRSAGARGAPGAGTAPPRLVLTAHDILPREPLPGQRSAQVRLYDHFDAVVVHSEHGRRRLIDGLGIDPGRVHVISHGAMAPPPARPGAPPPELPPPFGESTGPVVLFFGLLRPYKGLDVLLDAWRELEAGGRAPVGTDPGQTELWIAGMPRMDMAALTARAPRSVRFLERFVDKSEITALLGRASLVVLPYREIDASGAAFTALGAGVPLLLSDAGSFPDLARTGAARCTPAGDAQALAAALAELLEEPSALDAMAAAARQAAGPGGPYDWGEIAARTLALYASLLGERPSHRPAPVAA